MGLIVMPPGMKLLFIESSLAEYLQLVVGGMGENGQSQGHVHRAPSAPAEATPSGSEGGGSEERIEEREGCRAEQAWFPGCQKSIRKQRTMRVTNPTPGKGTPVGN